MKKAKITVKATLQETREEQGLMLHTELAKGHYGDDEFRLIQSLHGGAIRMEYKKLCLDLRLDDLGKAMLDAIEQNVPT